MKLEAGEARSRTSPFSSSGSAMRPSGTVVAHIRSCSGSGSVTPRRSRPLEGARADRVHEHAVRRELERRLPDDVEDRGLAGGVAVADHGLGPQARVRGRDDDPARALALHDRGGVLHREEDAVQVDAEHLVPVRALDGVEALAALDREPRRRGDAALAKTTSSPPSAATTSSTRAWTCASSETSTTNERTVAPRSASAGGDALEALGVDVGERDPRAAVREHLGHRQAEPARRAGDDGPRSADIEDPLLDAASRHEDGAPGDLALAQPVEHVVHLLERMRLRPQRHVAAPVQLQELPEVDPAPDEVPGTTVSPATKPTDGCATVPPYPTIE